MLSWVSRSGILFFVIDHDAPVFAGDDLSAIDVAAIQRCDRVRAVALEHDDRHRDLGVDEDSYSGWR